MKGHLKRYYYLIIWRRDGSIIAVLKLIKNTTHGPRHVSDPPCGGNVFCGGAGRGGRERGGQNKRGWGRRQKSHFSVLGQPRTRFTGRYFWVQGQAATSQMLRAWPTGQNPVIDPFSGETVRCHRPMLRAALPAPGAHFSSAPKKLAASGITDTPRAYPPQLMSHRVVVMKMSLCTLTVAAAYERVRR